MTHLNKIAIEEKFFSTLIFIHYNRYEQCRVVDLLKSFKIYLWINIIMYISQISEIKNSLKPDEMAFLSIWKVLAYHPDLLPQHSWGILSSLILLWIEAWFSQYWSQILASASVSLMTITMVHKFFRLIIRSRTPKYII